MDMFDLYSHNNFDSTLNNLLKNHYKVNDVIIDLWKEYIE